MGYREERDGLRFRRDQLFDRLTALETSEDDDARRALLEELDDVGRRLAALAPKHLPLLSSVRIAAPCPANWTSMVGTDRVRHCGICDKQVWNLTALEPEEAEALLSERRDRLPCMVLHRRRDGHFQDGDCTPGRRRVARAMATAVALGLGAAAAVLVGLSDSAVSAAPRVLRSEPATSMDVAAFFGDPPAPRIASLVAGSIVGEPAFDRGEPPRGSLFLRAVPDRRSGQAAALLVEQMLSGHRALRRCYSRVLRDDPTLGGRLWVRFRATPSGSVARVRVNEVDAVLSDVGRCAVRVIRGLRLDPPPDRAEAIEVELRLEPGSEAPGG